MTTQSKRGNVLAVTVFFVLALSIVAASILALALNSHRLTMRNRFPGRSASSRGERIGSAIL